MNWTELTRTTPAQAEVLRGLLQAHGIPVEWLPGGAGQAMGMIYGPLGEVTLLVPQEHAAAARDLYRRFLDGSLPAADAGQG